MYPITLHYIRICIIEMTVCNFSNDREISSYFPFITIPTIIPSCLCIPDSKMIWIALDLDKKNPNRMFREWNRDFRRVEKRWAILRVLLPARNIRSFDLLVAIHACIFIGEDKSLLALSSNNVTVMPGRGIDKIHARLLTCC